jgi:glycosyltransferase involved in cell wall biosynthesis
MIEREKTLVILSPGFPKDEADTTCVPSLQVFVRNLKLQFPLLHIVVVAFEYPFVSAKYQWHDIDVIAFGGWNRGKLIRLINWARIWQTLVSLNKRNELVGLLTFWMNGCTFLASAFARQKGLKHFCWILGQDARPGNKYFKWTKPKAEELLALSDFIAREVDKNYKIRPAHVIPLGIDPSLFGTAEVTRDIDLLGAGSLIPVKQFPILVNTVLNLRMHLPNIKAVICGDGPERAILDIMIRKLKLGDNIQLTGELSHASTLAMMQRTKIFVHPSVYEGFGVVCLEALHAGAQVVSFVHPMDTPIRNWHFVKNQNEMRSLVKNMLENNCTQHGASSPYLVADTCQQIMALYS